MSAASKLENNPSESHLQCLSSSDGNGITKKELEEDDGGNTKETKREKKLPLNFKQLNSSPINIFLFIQWAEQWKSTESTMGDARQLKKQQRRYRMKSMKQTRCRMNGKSNERNVLILQASHFFLLFLLLLQRTTTN